MEYSIKELLQRNEENKPPNEMLEFISEKFVDKMGVSLFQLCLFDKRAKRVYIFNIPHKHSQLSDSPQKSQD